MAEVGQQCLGEKHSDIIAKQRGVIAQLKQRVNDLELAKPPGIMFIVLRYTYYIYDRCVL